MYIQTDRLPCVLWHTVHVPYYSSENSTHTLSALLNPFDLPSREEIGQMYGEEREPGEKKQQRIKTTGGRL